VVPASQNAGQVPVVTAAPSYAATATVTLTLANQGGEGILYTLTPNDYEGSTQTVTVQPSSSTTISWPTNQYGYYDVVITANTSDGFRRRYAGRIA
jgi:phospholipase C